ncbi:MAG: twin-arginine translocase TatA/TatE family subunit [Bacteroidetes bacterium]|nr:twin-arginine translocase TatA/TatE family subunit [Bacteroidota bacterium]MCL6103081.1 twin-arginine translocase TatA/TatE family subunit [Bacteroidota bacterium]
MNLFILGVLSGAHVVLIIAAMLLLFGGSKIPELMGGLGKGMKEFKKAMKEDEPTTPPAETDEKKKEPLKE